MKELHTVALLKDIPSKKLRRGDVGTVVVNLSDEMAEVEFSNENGESIILVPLKKSDLIRLRMVIVPA